MEHGLEQKWSVVTIGKKNKFNEASQTKENVPPSSFSILRLMEFQKETLKVKTL
jgi:hypothetical protein